MQRQRRGLLLSIEWIVGNWFRGPDQEREAGFATRIGRADPGRIPFRATDPVFEAPREVDWGSALRNPNSIRVDGDADEGRRLSPRHFLGAGRRASLVVGSGFLYRTLKRLHGQLPAEPKILPEG